MLQMLPSLCSAYPCYPTAFFRVLIVPPLWSRYSAYLLLRSMPPKPRIGSTPCGRMRCSLAPSALPCTCSLCPASRRPARGQGASCPTARAEQPEVVRAPYPSSLAAPFEAWSRVVSHLVSIPTLLSFRARCHLSPFPAPPRSSRLRASVASALRVPGYEPSQPPSFGLPRSCRLLRCAFPFLRTTAVHRPSQSQCRPSKSPQRRDRGTCCSPHRFP